MRDHVVARLVHAVRENLLTASKIEIEQARFDDGSALALGITQDAEAYFQQLLRLRATLRG